MTKKYSQFFPVAQPQKDQFVVGRDPTAIPAAQNIIIPLTKFPLFDVDNPGGTLRIAQMLSIGDSGVPNIPLFVKGATADLIRLETANFECDIKYVRTGTGATEWESGVGGASPGGTTAFYWFNGGTYRLSLLANGVLHLPLTGKIGVGEIAPDTQIHTLGLPGVKVALHGPSMGGTAPTTITFDTSYLHLGGGEFDTNSFRLITFGFKVTGSLPTNPAAYMGFQEINTGGQTFGDLIFATRSVGSDTAATERVRITNLGLFGVGIITSGIINPKEALHVITGANASGLTASSIGAAITNDVSPRLIFEDTGETLNNKVFVTQNQSQIYSIGTLDDDGISNPVNIFNLKRIGQLGILTIPTANLDVNGSLAIGKDRLISGTSNTSQDDDYFLLCDTSGGPCTFTIQNTHNTARRSFIIKDMSGNANTNNITINTQNGDFLIDGVATQLITADKGAIRVYGDGTEFFVW